MMRIGLDADQVAVARAARQQADLHVAHDDVVRRALDADAEVRLRAVEAEDGDVVLAADRQLLRRLAPLAADVVEDGLLVEGAVVVQHQAAAARVVVDRGLRRRQRADDHRRRVAAAGDVAGKARDHRARG